LKVAHCIRKTRSSVVLIQMIVDNLSLQALGFPE
jgi:hypothetical protein